MKDTAPVVKEYPSTVGAVMEKRTRGRVLNHREGERRDSMETVDPSKELFPALLDSGDAGDGSAKSGADASSSHPSSAKEKQDGRGDDVEKEGGGPVHQSLACVQ